MPNLLACLRSWRRWRHLNGDDINDQRYRDDNRADLAVTPRIARGPKIGVCRKKQIGHCGCEPVVGGKAGESVAVELWHVGGDTPKEHSGRAQYTDGHDVGPG